MLSDMMFNVIPQEATPVAGKGALGTWRALASPGRRAGVPLRLFDRVPEKFWDLTNT